MPSNASVTETTRKTTNTSTTLVKNRAHHEMTLQTSNLLNLCDDIQWKIGKEIKFKRIEEDVKKRKAFLNMCMGSSVNLYSSVGKNVKFYNDCLRYQFEEEIHDKIHAVTETNNGNAFFVKTMCFFYLEIKVRILFYHIADELNCRNFYKACVDSYDPEMYLDDSDSDHDFYTDSDED